MIAVEVIEDWTRYVLQRPDGHGAWADTSGGFSVECERECDEVLAGLREIHGEENVRRITRRTITTDLIETKSRLRIEEI